MTSERSSECLEDETLVALIAGELLLDENPQIEAHLAECSNCQNIVAAAAAGLEGSRDETPDEVETFPKPGDVIAGKYRLEKLIGRGGMGTVFAARHDELGQTVAIKVLHSAAPTATARFQREAKISAQLLSEHTARVFDMGTSEGAPFLVMEYLTGEDLASVIGRGPVSPALVAEYGQQICAALAAAHAAGIIHRDLKPSNVFLTHREDGSLCLKVLDFGVSKRLLHKDTEQSHDLTNAHAILGSPAYMSPEQLRECKDVDARSDIWSLGVLLYELCTTRRPFQAPSLAALSAVIAADAPRPPSSLNSAVPAALDRVVMRCLRKEPRERYGSALEVAEALRAALPQIRRSIRRRRILAASALALVTAAFMRFAGAPSEQREIAPVRPRPQPEPGVPRLAVHCQPPYPLGQFRIESPAVPASEALPGAWPIVTLCTAGEAAPIRLELAKALASAGPRATLTLDPPHPCYALGVHTEAEATTLTLEHSDRCAAELTLESSGCELIRELSITAPGAPALRVTPTPETRTSGSDGCTLRVELPFAAYGKLLSIQLQPPEFSARDVLFSGQALRVPVNWHRPRRAARTPCVPPEYCRL